MRTIDFAPLFRSTVGFDRLFEMLDGTGRPEWPPHNIEKKGEDEYRITMAIAGFAPPDIEVTQQGNTLIVSGRKTPEERRHEFLHQGLKINNFTQTFNLADHVKVLAANLADGLLTIDLTREIPEQLKPRRITLGQSNGAGAATKSPMVESRADRALAA